MINGDLIPWFETLHHCGVEFTGLLLARIGKLGGVSGSRLAVELESELDHATPFGMPLSFDDDPGLPSVLMPSSLTEKLLLSSFALTFFLNFDLLFWNHIFT